jgi:hypothetical protein
LTATITQGLVIDTKVFTLTVLAETLDPDIALVVADKAALTDAIIRGGNADLSTVIGALANPLPAAGAVNGSAIAWASSLPLVISNDGQTVVRPVFGTPDASVTMTATFTKGAIIDTKVFTLIVLHQAPSTIATVTSTTYSVSAAVSGAGTITNVPFGTSKASFLAAIAKGQFNQTWNNAGIADPVVSSNTLVVTAQDGTTVITYTVTVSADPDIALVAADKIALTDAVIKGSNTDLSNIIGALTNPLPATGTNGSTITWVSNKPAVISNDGQAVVRPAFASGDATVTMSATFTKGLVTDTKIFTMIVLKQSASTIATVTSATYTVSAVVAGAGTISKVPFGATKTAFLAALAKGQPDQT